MPINLPKVTYWTIFWANLLQIFDILCSFPFSNSQEKIILELRWRNQWGALTKPATIGSPQNHCWQKHISPEIPNPLSQPSVECKVLWDLCYFAAYSGLIVSRSPSNKILV